MKPLDPSDKWTWASPVMRRLYRALMLRSSSRAVADALKAASAKSRGADQRRLATLARRMATCAVSTYPRVVTPPGDESRIFTINKRSCRTAICMQCARRRAANNRKVVLAELALIRKTYPTTALAFLTLTSANRPVGDLNAMLSDHEAALTRFWRLASVNRAVLGHVTGIEIAVRGTKAAPEVGVHSHSLIILVPGYFDFSKNTSVYLSQQKIVELWKASLRVPYKPICDIRRIHVGQPERGTFALNTAVTETVKYAIAPHKVFARKGFDLAADPKVIGPLALALYKRRLLRYGGLFTKAKRELNAANAKPSGGAHD